MRSSIFFEAGAFALILSCGSAVAQTAPASVVEPSDPTYNVHFQTTIIDQAHSRFHALYSGRNSLSPDRESAVSVTSTLFLGWSPWRGTSFYVDPELSGGQGLSGALGVAGSANGETYRIGNPKPLIKTARAYMEQVFAMGPDTEKQEDGPNQLAGHIPDHRVTVVAGKFGMMDWFDNNAYSHDPRTQFMNWALANSAAWDYPADVFGYTWGAVSEYHTPTWAVRGGAAAVTFDANQAVLDRRVGRAHGFALEGEHESPFEDHKGAFRLLLYYNEARMGNYDETIANPAFNMDVTQTRAYGHSKYGFTSSDDIELTSHLGGFTRLSWDDGRNETWSYTEVDGSAALGAEWTPAVWGRPSDRWGTAQLVNVLSDPHRRYLSDGGSGFILGDGALHYGPEIITETYYRAQVREMLQVSPDFQLVINPGYNRARGPVPIWGLRVHTEF